MSVKSKKNESIFVFKPFVHNPDSVIKIGDDAENPIWVDRWSRRCGNPKHGKRLVKLEK